MKKVYLISLLATLSLSVLTAQSQPEKGVWPFHGYTSGSRSVFLYTLTIHDEPYNDLTGSTSINNGEAWDDPEYVVPIFFPFELNGNPITFLQFLGSGSLLAAPTGDPDILTAVFPFEMDLIDRGFIDDVSLSPISYKVEGPNGSRIQKIEWKNAGSYEEYAENDELTMFINFQLWLYEGSNRIEFRFGSNNITNPALFYGGFGEFMGTTDADQTTGEYYNPHFFAGDINKPVLSDSETTIDGTPSEGYVYRLSLELPVEVTVTGQNGNSTCEPNGSATANATGGIEPYTYLWSNGGTTETITDLDAGTYTVTVTDDDGSTASASTTITNASPINPNASATDETTLDGNDGTATSSAFGGTAPYSFDWSNGGTTQTITNLAPGIYTVTVTDASDCTAEQSVIVGAFGCPTIILGVDILDATCSGTCNGEIDLTVTGGAAPYTYIWSNGVATEDLLDLCAGDYFVIVLDNDGCSVAGGPYTISESTPLVVDAGVTGETDVDANDGTSWAATTGGVAPYTYAWSNGAIDSLITGLAPGIYSVIVTDLQNCTAFDTVTVDSFACSLVGLVTNNICYGECDGFVEVILINAAAPVTFTWDNGGTLPFIDSLCAGSYTVTAVDAAGCTDTETYTVTEGVELLINIGSTDETAQDANDGTAWVAPTGGVPPYSYNWSNGSTDSLIVDLTPGTYTVTVTDLIGCEVVQGISVNQFVCAGVIQTDFNDLSCYLSCDGSASAELIGGVGPVTYLWNTGDTTTSLILLCEGVYEVTITDIGQNCVGVLTFDILQPDSLYIQVDEVIHVTDSTLGSILVTVVGGTEEYTHAWYDELGNAISPLEDLTQVGPGTYYPGVVDANGCTFFIDGIVIEDNTVSTLTLINTAVRLFPNPANEQVYIDMEDITGFQILLRSFDGQVVRSWKGENTLDVSSIPSGVYLVEGISGSQVFRQRLVIAR